MNISKYDKAEILAALFNVAKPLGLGVFHFRPAPMTKEIAKEILKGGSDFDYIQGRVMKINLSGNELDTRLYNRDNGKDAAETIIATLEKSLSE